MLLSECDVKEFQEMWFRHFNKTISKEFAYEAAIRLIEFVEVVYQPITEEDLLKVEESRKEMKEKLGQ